MYFVVVRKHWFVCTSDPEERNPDIGRLIEGLVQYRERLNYCHTY